MLLQAAAQTSAEPSTDWLRIIEELAPRFAARAPAYDSGDAFVAENYTELKARGVFAAGVPRELGGGGASYRSLCEMLQALGRACGSTALALSMHTHLVSTMVWRWRRDPKPFEPLLRRIAAERLVLATSGASDWLTATGKAERVAGGFRISARKIFASGIPAADLFMTQALYDDPDAGPTVLHFALPVRDPAILPQDNWRVLGMRGTGSQDVAIQDAFVPDAAVAMRRPAGQWTPLFHVYACMIPLPLIYGVYVGIAEAARDAALAQARKRPADPGLATWSARWRTTSPPPGWRTATWSTRRRRPSPGRRRPTASGSPARSPAARCCAWRSARWRRRAEALLPRGGPGAPVPRPPGRPLPPAAGTHAARLQRTPRPRPRC